MKKLILLLAIVAAMAVPAMANFTFTQTELLNLTTLTGPTFDIVTADHTLVSSEYTAYDYIGSFLGDVGYVGTLSGNASTYIGTTDSGILSAAEADGTYVLTIHNDNDDNWSYYLTASGAGGGSSASQTLLTGETGYFTLAISGAITDIGFVITNAKSDTDAYHTSVTVPVPGAMLLGGIGVGFVGWLRRRRAL